MKQRIAAWLRPSEVSVVETQVTEKHTTDKEANVTSNSAQTASDGERDSDEISLSAQAGVQDVEAFAKVWTKGHLILAYITYV